MALTVALFDATDQGVHAVGSDQDDRDLREN